MSHPFAAAEVAAAAEAAGRALRGARTIRATQHTGDRVTAAGLSAGSVCSLCRALQAAGHDPATPMTVTWPDGRPSLMVPTIGGAAKLTVRESTRSGHPEFVRWSPPQKASSVHRVTPHARGADAGAPRDRTGAEARL